MTGMPSLEAADYAHGTKAETELIGYHQVFPNSQPMS